MDETQPLLGHFVEQQTIVINRSQVDFDPDGDPDNPLEWSRAYKLEVVSLLVIMAFTVYASSIIIHVASNCNSRTFTCSGVVPVANRIVFDLQGEESKSAGILLVTVWELGEAAGPLLIAPLSEIYGRYPVFNVANIVFIIGVLLAAVSQTTSLFIFARFLTGFAVASNVLNPAIIGDIFSSELRGSGMSLVMFAPVVGGAIGPAVCGAIAESLGWRMVLWISATVAIICEILFYFLLRETYKVSILQRRAARLRKETNDGSFKYTWDGESGATRISWLALRTAITRPVVVMLSSTVLQIISLYGGIVFSLYYVLATTLPAILGNIYGFSPTLVGSSFLSFSTNICIPTFYCLAHSNFNRRWCGRRSCCLQCLPRCHICQAWRIEGKDLLPRRSATTVNWRSNLPTLIRCNVWMDITCSMAGLAALAMHRTFWVWPYSCPGTFILLYRGFFRPLLSFCYDHSSHCPMSGRNLASTDYSSPN